MTITITKAHIATFDDNVRHLAQQMQSKLRPYVEVVNKESKSHTFNRIGELAASAKSAARTTTPQSDSPWSGRMTATSTYHIGDTFEPEDMAQMLVNPQAPIAKTLAAGMERKVDDILIADALGTALDDAGSNVTYTTAQTIGDGSAEISIDGILQVDELFFDNDVEADVKKCFVIGPKQRRKLLQLLEMTSSDFQRDRAALATGFLPNFLGYDFLVSTRLNVPSSGELDCIVLAEGGMGLHIAKDIWTRVSERPDQSYNTQLYAAMSIDSVRIQDELVVRYHVADTVT